MTGRLKLQLDFGAQFEMHFLAFQLRLPVDHFQAIQVQCRWTTGSLVGYSSCLILSSLAQMTWSLRYMRAGWPHFILRSGTAPPSIPQRSPWSPSGWHSVAFTVLDGHSLFPLVHSKSSGVPLHSLSLASQLHFRYFCVYIESSMFPSESITTWIS